MPKKPLNSPLLLEGPFESDYSLAMVNRLLAYAMLDTGVQLALHQRDNTTSYAPSPQFLAEHPRLAGLFAPTAQQLNPIVHSRNIFPPYTDSMRGEVNAFHSYGWEESSFPREYVNYFNSLNIITVISEYVRRVLRCNGVKVPIVVVGNGADHILSVSSVECDSFADGLFTFLHISSGFPRKATDLLIEAFCREFKRRDGVALFIKTFDNPHNNIRAFVETAHQRYPEHAPIRVATDSLSMANIRYLYEQAGCLVLASRGEGFGLPAAEAMFLGRPVIATCCSGLREFCSDTTCWPVDFELSQARSHLSDPYSYWAEPSVASLQRQMRAVLEASAAEIALKTSVARDFVESRFTWRLVAERQLQAYEGLLDHNRKVTTMPLTAKRKKIGFISTWNTRCGIAGYTRYLATALDSVYEYCVLADHTDARVGSDEDFVARCWGAGIDNEVPPTHLDALINEILERDLDLVSLQYNFNFLRPRALAYLVQRLEQSGIPLMITLHSTDPEFLAPLTNSLLRASLCVVHRKSDLDRLMNFHVENAIIQPHGNYVHADPDFNPLTPADPHGIFVLSCFGFFLPQKGIYELLQAFHLALQSNPNLRLNLWNSFYSAQHSHAYAKACAEFITTHHLGSYVSTCTEFLAEEQIVAALRSSDLVVLPYPDSTESVSGAIRFPLASLRPVLCSDLPLFQEFADVTHQFPRGNVIALANRILDLAEDRNLLLKHHEAQKQRVEAFSWKNVAATFARNIETLLEPLHQERAISSRLASTKL